MTNYTAPIAQLAAIAYAAYYRDELDTFLDAYTSDPQLSDEPFDRDALADMLCSDIRDLLHNANDSELFPFLDDEPYDESLQLALSRRFHDDYDQLAKLADAIADIMLATDPLPYR